MAGAAHGEEIRCEVGGLHAVGHARRAAAALAAAVGFDSARASAVALVATELATNIVRHARGRGAIVLRPLQEGGRAGIEVLSEDEGPGIADVARALQDGYSTAGGLGGGLGCVRRLMDEVEIARAGAAGTRVVARTWRR